MVVIEVDDKLSQVEKRLGNLSDKAPKVICFSLNDTAKWARRELAKEAQKAYTVKMRGFTHDLKIKRATYSRLEAELDSQGAVFPLNHFKFSVGKRTTKANVLKQGSSNRPLEIDGIKAFVAKFASGHVALAQRRGKDRLPIKTFYSSSIPNMIGDEKRVYGVVEPQMMDKLNHYLEYHIKKVLEGYE